jgi:hypothetical protein
MREDVCRGLGYWERDAQLGGVYSWRTYSLCDAVENLRSKRDEKQFCSELIFSFREREKREENEMQTLEREKQTLE